jgi:cytohesin
MGFSENKYKDLLKQAIDLNKIDIIRYMLEKKFLDVNGSDYLYYAVHHHNRLEILRLLLDHGADPNNIDYNKLYSFTSECGIDTDEIMKLFLTYGLNVNGKGRGRGSILHYVAYYYDIDTMRHMIPHISRDNVDIHLVLDFLIRSCEISDVKRFLDHMSGTTLLNGQTRAKGDTPLHYAVRNADSDIVTLLLSYGADFTIKNKDNLTAKDLARSINEDDMVAILQSYEDAPTVKNAID